MRNILSPDRIDRIRDEVRNVRDRYVAETVHTFMWGPGWTSIEQEESYRKTALRKWEYAHPALTALLNEGEDND